MNVGVTIKETVAQMGSGITGLASVGQSSCEAGFGSKSSVIIRNN